MNINKYIGNKIKNFRINKNITQEELGEFLNTTSQTISRYENGKLKTNQDILFKLAEYFNVSINEFFPPVNGTTPDILSDYMRDEKTGITQLAIITGIKPNEIKNIYYGREKLPKPSTLIKLAKALKLEPIYLLIGAGYVDDEELTNDELYETGIRYLLTDEEREILCTYLVNYWNKSLNKHNYTFDEIYGTIFEEDKKEFSINDVRNMMNHGSIPFTFDINKVIEITNKLNK